jgi:hypothetical protein
MLQKLLWMTIYLCVNNIGNHSKCCKVCNIYVNKRFEFTFWTAIFVKYGILTEYLTPFWFAMLVNRYKLNVSIQKSSKDAKFGQCLYLRVPLCYEQNWCAERTLQHPSLTIIRRRRGDYRRIKTETKSRFLFTIITEPEVNNCFSIIS